MLLLLLLLLLLLSLLFVLLPQLTIYIAHMPDVISVKQKINQKRIIALFFFECNSVKKNNKYRVEQ